MAETILKAENLTILFGGLKAVDNFSIEIKEGETCTQAEIDEFCQAMPRYKRPRKVFFDKVPRNPTGKIEKPVLREKYCGKRLVEAQITG